ncbi:MAG: hypothetical protein ABR545_05355 [Cyclonatronaceae bacterium]
MSVMQVGHYAAAFLLQKEALGFKWIFYFALDSDIEGQIFKVFLYKNDFFKNYNPDAAMKRKLLLAIQVSFFDDRELRFSGTGNQGLSPSILPCADHKKICVGIDQWRFLFNYFHCYNPLKEVPNASRTKPANNK